MPASSRGRMSTPITPTPSLAEAARQMYDLIEAYCLNAGHGTDLRDLVQLNQLAAWRTALDAEWATTLAQQVAGAAEHEQANPHVARPIPFGKAQRAAAALLGTNGLDPRADSRPTWIVGRAELAELMDALEVPEKGD